MIDPKKVLPLLSNMTVNREIGRGPNGTVYQVTRNIDGKKLALKHIPIPASDAQTKALIFAGAVSGEADAQRYYNTLVKDIKNELLLLNSVKNASNLLKVRGYQVDQKLTGIGYDVYVLSDYRQTLSYFLSMNHITKLQAVNLAIDLCSALEQLRTEGIIHKDVRPNNVYLSENNHFMVGDLGLVKISDLEYNSIPDGIISDYTAPEVLGEDAPLSDVMDIYSVGMILYEIYNGGALPSESLGRYNNQDVELPAPAYADMAVADIIMQAISFDPEKRYQSPTDMKQAFVLYLQRGNVTKEPLVPMPESDTEEVTVDIAAIAATVEAGQIAEGLIPEPVEEVPELVVIENESAPRPSLNDLGEDELLLPADQEISIEDFIASMRGIGGVEVVSLDADGNTVTVPGYETEADLPADTEFVESADNHAEPAPIADHAPFAEIAVDPDQLPESEPAPESPAPVGDEVPSIEIPVQEVLLDVEEEEAEESVPVSRRKRRKSRPEPAIEDDVNVYDDGYEEMEGDEKSGGAWKKVLISVIVLLVLAAGTYGLYVFKTDTIHEITPEVLSCTSVHIAADSKNGSAMNVVCSNATGEVSRVPLTAEGATFTELNPNTTYTFTLESSESKLLLGGKTTEAKTKQMTNLTGFAASHVSAVTAKLALSGTGEQPDKWVVTVTSDKGEIVTAESSDVEITVEGLTPATNYTATIARGDNDLLGGTTSCTFTTMDYTTLVSYSNTFVDTQSASVQWLYEGTVPETWTVTCEGTDGNTFTEEVSGNATECTFEGLTSGATYTFTLSCASLRETESNSINVTIPSVTVTEITSIQNEDGSIEVNWEYTTDSEPTEWNISYAYDCVNAVTPTMVTSDTNSLIIEDVLPDANYTIKIEGADGLVVCGTAETTCLTEAAEPYTNYGCTDTSMTLYVLEDNTEGLETPSDTFAPDEHIAFSIEASYEASEDEMSADTLYIIRDSNGTPVRVYTSSKTWPGTWTTMYHTGDVPHTVEVPGTYTFEAYFDGCLKASAEFSVSE